MNSGGKIIVALVAIIATIIWILILFNNIAELNILGDFKIVETESTPDRIKGSVLSIRLLDPMNEYYIISTNMDHKKFYFSDPGIGDLDLKANYSDLDSPPDLNDKHAMFIDIGISFVFTKKFDIKTYNGELVATYKKIK